MDKDLVETDDKNALKVPFTKTAGAMGKKIVANIVMIGFLTGYMDIIPKKKMTDTIKAGKKWGNFMVLMATD